MILILPKIVEGFNDGAERDLTHEELLTVTSQGFNGTHYVYYQGDEPIIEPQPIIEPPNWLGLEQALFYSGLRAKAKASANLDMFEFSSLIGAFSNSKNGTVSENTLYYLLNAINADWDSNDIAQLNGFLAEFNFTIRLT